MHMISISPTFYKKNIIKKVYDNTVCPGKLLWCLFVNGNVFFSQHILNKAKIHAHVLLCCLKCPVAVTHFVFITVMQFIFNVEMNRLIKKDRIQLIKVTFYPEKLILFT